VDPYIINTTDLTWYSEGNPDTWVPSPYSSLYDIGHQEVLSFYWGITVLTSVGVNITPRSFNEYIYSAIVILIGVIFYAIIIANITNIIQTYNVEDIEQAAELDRLHHYLKKNKVPPYYYDFITTYIEEQWKNEDPELSKDILRLVPKHNINNLKKLIWKRLLYKCPILSLVDINSYFSIVSRLEKRIYITGDFICRRNECGDEMYLLYYGKVDSVAMDDISVYYSIYPGDHFGEQCLLSSGIVRRECSFRASTNVHVYVLRRSVYNETILKSPELYYFIRSINETRASLMKPVTVRKNLQITTRTTTNAKVDDSTSNKIFRLGANTPSLKKGPNRDLIMRPTVVYEEEESDLMRTKMPTEERIADDMLFGNK
jgi:CRP-like cAMP-binding protein